MDLQSLGYAAGLYQHSPKAIRTALKATGKSKPDLILNGLAYFEADAIIKAIRWIGDTRISRDHRQRQQIADAVQKRAARMAAREVHVPSL